LAKSSATWVAEANTARLRMLFPVEAFVMRSDWLWVLKSIAFPLTLVFGVS